MNPEYIGKYKIEKILGKGAMGVVYSGRDPLMDRKVAIKTIHGHLLEGSHGQEFKDRFKTEATAAGKCNHTNIVTYLNTASTMACLSSQWNISLVLN